MNKTLAGWLGYDLTQVGSGGATLAYIVANNGATLLAAMSGAPGEVRTEQIDLDLRAATASSLPVRLLHQVAFGQDGAPGASRTLVLNRAAGEEPEEGSARRRGAFRPLLQFDADGDRRRSTAKVAFSTPTPPSRSCCRRR